jgi:hypothetical protein
MATKGEAAAVAVDRRQVLRFRFAQHELDVEPGSRRRASDVAVLDAGVQDTGPDGARWALVVRGAPEPGPEPGWAGGGYEELALAWTLRGAPHAYRRSELAAVAVATAPWSEADAAKRIFDAAKSYKAAGIPVLDALRTVAGEERRIVQRPTVKGELSTELTARLEEPYLRFCRPCNATHVFEQPFRIAALQAGLVLEPATSPPVLRRAEGLAPPMYEHLAGDAEPAFDVLRNHLRFFGPARVKDAAGFVDAPSKDVKGHWPEEVVPVQVRDDAGSGPRAEPRWLLAEHLDALTAGAGRRSRARTIRLLGPFDPYLQLRDRELLVPDADRRKAMWPVLGRPGAVVADGEVVGAWRPKAAGRKLTLRLDLWDDLQPEERAAVGHEAERLAAFRGVGLAAITDE